MLIITIEGLSLTGKTTICNQLVNYFSAKGLKCKYCHHGHLTDDSLSELYYQKAIHLINDWDFNNTQIIYDFLDLGFKSLKRDYEKFMENIQDMKDIDIFILDRHFADQYVAAKYFNYIYEKTEILLPNYYEIILVCDYKQAIYRSQLRNDNHGKLTDYILSSEAIYTCFQSEYSDYYNKKNIYTCELLDNTNYTAIQKILRKFEELI